MQPQAIIFFDGHCHLCCRSVQFVLRRDKKGFYCFAPLQGKTAETYLRHWSSEKTPDSVVLYESGKWFDRSTASLHIAKKLSGGWQFLYALIIIPRPIRDFFYRYIARNRYRWFGRSETCWIPKPEWKERFLD